jgi:multiple sugar transport system substrate-binding protein
MKLFRTVAGLGALVITGTALAACSPAASDPEDVTLTWWATQHTSSVAETEAIFEPVIEAFTEETGIEVEMEVIPWADLYNRILTAISSGTGPDVLNIGTTWTASLHDTGALAEVSGDNLEWMGGSDRFIPSVWEAAQIPGEPQTAVPFLSNVYSLYYNTAIFEEAGIEAPPATWEEFLSVAEQLTQDTDGDGRTDQWGFTFPVAAATASSHMAFILGQQLGGEFVDDEGAVTIDSPEMVEAVEAYVDLMSEQQVMSPSDAELDLNADIVDQLINGQAAMFFQQAPIEQFRNRDFEDWAIAEMPVHEGGDPVMSMVAGTNITVFEDSLNKQQAFELVGWLTSPEQNAKMAVGATQLPTVTEAYDQPELQDGDQDTLDIRRSIQENNVAPFPLVPNIGEIEQGIGNAIREMFQAYATGGDPDVAGRLEAAATQLN